MSDRIKLPNRRHGTTIRIEANGVVAHATANFDAKGKPYELFLAGPKPGSAMAVLLEDIAVVVSVALQYGVPPGALSKSLARVPVSRLTPIDLATPQVAVPTAVASVLGAALVWLARLEDDDSPNVVLGDEMEGG